jgi:hypothetical protein
MGSEQSQFALFFIHTPPRHIAHKHNLSPCIETKIGGKNSAKAHNIPSAKKIFVV